jgi:hypothetical protein
VWVRRGVVTFFVIVAVVTWGLAGTASASTANLVRNGNFSSPRIGVSGLGYFSTGQSIPHWRIVGAPGNVALTTKTFVQNGYAFECRWHQPVS